VTIETILPIPDIFAAKRVLCIQPHYDDNDIAAAGTFALLKRAGIEIIYLTVTDDLMGVVDGSLSDQAAAEALNRDQHTAGEIIGVDMQYSLGYPDAGVYDYFALRKELLRYIRMIKPDVIFAPDPWLTYEAHRDHIQTGLATSEAIIFAGLPKITSSDPSADSAYIGHELKAVVFYYTREPNKIIDITSVWEVKVAAVRCYKAQFNPQGMDELVMALDLKSQQVAISETFTRGEPLKILHPAALHCGL